MCKRLDVSEQTFYRWRLKYRALKEDEAQRLKALEQSWSSNEKRKCPAPRRFYVCQALASALCSSRVM